ncbi:MAG: acyl-CoA dehydrogenase family protein [Planctomycetota bacterium]|jgi:alkylation response protein AidB-like acyl-CoA dehydrogenase
MQPSTAACPLRLLDEIRDLEPLIRELAPQAERERRLSEPVVQALRDRGFFRLFRPAARGGFELDPMDGFRLIEELARIDSAAGWNVGLANAVETTGPWFCDEVTEEVFGPADTVMAGAWNPPRKAMPCDGGYLMSGRTPFASNCHNATWFTGLARVYDGDEPRSDESGHPITYVSLFPRADVRIIENWDTLGMCGTGSDDIVLDEVFVPEARMVPLVLLEHPSSAYAGPLHRLSVWPGVAVQVPSAFGIACAAIDDFLELAGVKTPRYTSSVLRARSVVQLQIAQARGKLDAARAYFYSVLEKVWQRALNGDDLELSHRAEIQLACSHGVVAAAEAVRLVHAAAGASAIRNDQPFQRHFRDIHVITQHAFVSASRLEDVGQVLLGLEPDWPFLHI